MYANKVKILKENVNKKSQNTQVKILAWQKSKAQGRIWIVRNYDVCIAKT